MLAHATAHHLLAFGRRELLWLSGGAATGVRLNLRAIEQLIGPWTMRTMETVEQLVSRYFDQRRSSRARRPG